MQPLFRHGCVLRAFAGTLLALGLHAHGQFVATGVDEGVPPHVKVFSGSALTESMSFFAYGTSFSGGVRVAVGDVNGDSHLDIITAPGNGTGPHVKVFSGASGAEIGSFFAYDPAFTGGVFVATGDINNDGADDIITAAGPGGGPHIKVFSGVDNTSLGSFFAYDPGFTGGVRVAVGDVNGDGFADIITGTATVATQVKVFSGQTWNEIGAFFAYSPSFQGGVFVAAGDVNGDGKADVITGAGPGAGPHVKVFSGATLGEIKSFFAYDVSFSGGVRVAAGDINGDGRADLITAPGSGAGPLVRVLDGRSNTELKSFNAYDPGFTGGIFVGSRAPRITTQFTVTTEPATNIGFTTATLRGSVDANGGTATVSFEYGSGADFSNMIPAKPSEVAGRMPAPVNADVTGLAPGTTYVCRTVATDPRGDRTYGQPVTFTATINISPSGGTFTVLPKPTVPDGTALTASFAAWTDAEGHTPLTYEVLDGPSVIVPAGTNPVPTFTLPAGTHQVRGRIYDSLGSFTETGVLEVVVVGDPESALVFTTGDAVPGSGTGGIPQDAKWTRFGVPAIDDSGAVAFAGKWESAAGQGGGIFHDGTMLTLAGSPVPGAGTGNAFGIPDGAVFRIFKDPVIDDGGLVAFIATISGKGVTTANDTVVVSNGRTGALEVIAREGSPAPGTNGAKFRFFNGVSARVSQGQSTGIQAPLAGGTIFTARLAGVGSRENEGAWWVPPGAPGAILLVRKGGDGFAPGEKIKNFILLESLSGTPGQGRGHIDADKALLQVSLSGGKQAQVLATPGKLEVIAETGDPVGDSSVWVRVSQPSADNPGQNLAVLGSINEPNSTGSRPGVGILKSVDGGATWSTLAEVGKPVRGNVFAIWLTVGHAINSPIGADVGFLGKVKEPSLPPYSGIWRASESGDVELVAREGEQAAECAAGEKWIRHKAFALVDRTTFLFISKMQALQDRVPRRKIVEGAWAVDRAGDVRLLVREGGAIEGTVVKHFNLLREVDGSPGVTRAFNNRRQVVWHATYEDGTTGIVLTQVP
jgi:hypothetical protein